MPPRLVAFATVFGVLRFLVPVFLTLVVGIGDLTR